MTKLHLNYLRFVGCAEGASLLLLFFVAMPLRSAGYNPVIVRVTGAIHGLLFLIYIYALVDSRSAAKWSKTTLVIGLITASIPFGTFWFDRKYLRTINVRTAP